jgi:hypothetical protein
MAVVNRMELGRELMRTIAQINRQIEAVEKGADALHCKVYDLRDANGNYILAPLLSAKAMSLHALAIINQKDQ